MYSNDSHNNNNTTMPLNGINQFGPNTGGFNYNMNPYSTGMNNNNPNYTGNYMFNMPNMNNMPNMYNMQNMNNMPNMNNMYSNNPYNYNPNPNFSTGFQPTNTSPLTHNIKSSPNVNMNYNFTSKQTKTTNDVS
jgi:hypothetical protein